MAQAFMVNIVLLEYLGHCAAHSACDSPQDDNIRETMSQGVVARADKFLPESSMGSRYLLRDTACPQVRQKM